MSDVSVHHVYMNENSDSPEKHILTAWLLGCILYMFLAIEVIADAGFFAIPFQAVMGAAFSLVLVGIAFLLGNLFRVPALSRLWYSSAFPPVTLITVAIAVLLFGRTLGLTVTLQSSETGITYKTLHPLAGYGSLLSAVFGALHFSTGSYIRPNHG